LKMITGHLEGGVKLEKIGIVLAQTLNAGRKTTKAEPLEEVYKEN